MTPEKMRAGLWATALVVVCVAAFRVTLADAPEPVPPMLTTGSHLYSGIGMR